MTIDGSADGENGWQQACLRSKEAERKDGVYRVGFYSGQPPTPKSDKSSKTMEEECEEKVEVEQERVKWTEG